jgi:hypothetical protein
MYNARTGQNTQETILAPVNVNGGQFGKLFSVAVDGYVCAQPLYLSKVTIAGRTHNVLYVATEHDSLYAIDADDGTVYWRVSLIHPGGSTVNSVSDLACQDLVPEIGITGTPVIDTSTGTIYLVAKSKVDGNLVQYLHAIDVVTATEKFGGPVLIQASVLGTASDGNGTTVSFSPHLQHQRASLLLENGHVVIAWGSHCDISPWHGWVMSYRAITLAQEAGAPALRKESKMKIRKTVSEKVIAANRSNAPVSNGAKECVFGQVQRDQTWAACEATRIPQ